MQTSKFYLIRERSCDCFDISCYDNRSIYLRCTTIWQFQMAKTTYSFIIEYYYLARYVFFPCSTLIFFSFFKFVLLVSCILASPYYHHYGLIIYPNNHAQCALLSDEEMQKYFRIYTVTLYYFIPLIIIVLTYTSLLHFIYSKENKLRQNMVKTKKKKIVFLLRN